MSDKASRAAGALFSNQLPRNLSKFAPNLNSTDLAGVRQSVYFTFTLPSDQQPEVIKAYVETIRAVFLMLVPAGGMASLCSL